MLATDVADRRAGRVPRRGRLADGREILYFDDAGAAQTGPPPDRRSLEPSAEPAEIRRDQLSDEPVIIATHRQGRTHLPAAAQCPLCPTGDASPTEIPARAYDVVVFENRFPSLPAVAAGAPPAGRCEVVCYTSEHDASITGLPSARLATLVAAWIHRTTALEALPGVAYVMAFENRGEAIGVTLHHPHGQVYAYPFVPPRIARMATVAAAAGGCIGCETLARELAGPRVVAEDEHAVAYVPEAARWPYEIHVVPRRHTSDLGTLEPEERLALAERYADAFGRMDRLFAQPVPAMAAWLTAPVGFSADRWHLRAEIATPQRDVGKLKFLAGSESLAGAFINDVRPEDAAARLRDAIR